MTRKRFIKLAMSHGMSRNEAQRNAECLNKSNVPYRFAYNLMFFEVRFGAFLKAMGTCAQELAYKLNECGMSLREFIEKVKLENNNEVSL